MPAEKQLSDSRDILNHFHLACGCGLQEHLSNGNAVNLEGFLAERGILIAVRPRTRLVTHLGVSESDVRRVATEIAAYFASLAQEPITE